jgi:hypothetical protein
LNLVAHVTHLVRAGAAGSKSLQERHGRHVFDTYNTRLEDHLTARRITESPSFLIMRGRDMIGVMMLLANRRKGGTG